MSFAKARSRVKLALLLRVAIDYFEKKKDKLRLTKAYYYYAVYYDPGNPPQAQAYYLKALEAGKSSADHAMLGRIYAKTGALDSSNRCDHRRNLFFR